MSILVSFLQALLLIFGALIAVGIAYYLYGIGLYGIGTGLVGMASIRLARLPGWVRWIILLPSLGLSGSLLIITFNLVFWVGSWFGDTFVGTAWIWGTTFIQAAIVPSMLVSTGFVVAPAIHRWVAIAVMIAIWLWVAGLILDPETGNFSPRESDFWGFYGALALSACAAAYGVSKVWRWDQLIRLLELGLQVDGAVVLPVSCPNCGAISDPTESFCVDCGAEL